MKTLLESADAPSMIVFGGRADATSAEPEMTVMDRFNQMALENPLFGRNAILDRLSQFDNSAMYSSDDEPELDEYVQTLFIDNLGENGYTLNGDPYGEFKKMQADMMGTEVEPEGPAYAESAADFMAAFGQVFGKHV